jgi:hypothetical protein
VEASIGDAATYLDRAVPDAWVDALRALEAHGAWRAASNRARRRAECVFEARDAILDQYETVIEGAGAEVAHV